MERPPLHKNSLFRLYIFVFLLSIAMPAFSADFKSSMVRPLMGNPVVVSIEGVPLQMKGRMVLNSNERIRTGSRDRVLIQISENKNCQFILEPKSILEFGGIISHHSYRAYLLKGVMSVRNAACKVIVDVRTDEGRLHGQNSIFSLEATGGTTTVQLKRGSMRFFIGSESILLRAMTRTTISRTGIHRISSVSGKHRGRSPSQQPNALPGRMLKGRISPVSATVMRP